MSLVIILGILASGGGLVNVACACGGVIIPEKSLEISFPESETTEILSEFFGVRIAGNCTENTLISVSVPSPYLQ
jgi:hypothetical protein